MSTLDVATRSHYPRSKYVVVQPGELWSRIYMESLGIRVEEVSSLKDLWGVDIPSSFKYSRCEELCGLDLSTGGKIRAVLEDTTVDDLIGCFLQDLFNVVGDGGENSVDDFGKSLLVVSGIKRLPHVWMEGPTTDQSMIMGREERMFANPTISVGIKGSKIVLVAQTDKNYFRSEHNSAEAQLAAAMVVAFNRNYLARLANSQRMYGFTMCGTFCTFYRLDMDEKVLKSITEGRKRPLTDPPLTKLCKFSFGEPLMDVRGPRIDFLAASKDNMRQTLLVFEALRRIIESIR